MTGASVPRDPTRSAQTAALAGPPLDLVPVPRRTAADRPAWLGEQISLPPDVDGVPLDAEAFGDLDQADGFALPHAEHCRESLDTRQECRDNQYMTTEYGIYNDEGLIERDFWRYETAETALITRGDEFRDYGGGSYVDEDGQATVWVEEMCVNRQHESGLGKGGTCEECEEEGDDDA